MRVNTAVPASKFQDWRCASPTDFRLTSPRSILQNRYKKTPFPREFMNFENEIRGGQLVQ